MLHFINVYLCRTVESYGLPVPVTHLVLRPWANNFSEILFVLKDYIDDHALSMAGTSYRKEKRNCLDVYQECKRIGVPVVA